MNSFFNNPKNERNAFFSGQQKQSASFETKQVDGVYQAVGERMDLAAFYSRIYQIVAMGVGLSAVISLITLYFFPGNIRAMLLNPAVLIGLCIAEFILVFVLSAKSLKDAPSSLPLFFLYSALNGVTLSVIISFYAPGLVTAAFFISMAMFIVLSLYGRLTKRDLSGVGKACMAGLFGLIVLGIVSIFIPFGNGLALLLSAGMIIVFSGLIAYDNNMIKKYYEAVNGQVTQGMAIQSALQLYLNFVNIFVYLLRLLSILSED